WIRGALSGRLSAALVPGGGSGPDVFLLDDHHGIDGQAGSSGVCADCHRTRTDLDSPDRNPRNQSLGEPCAQHGTSDLCGRMGAFAIVALLAGSDCGRSAGRRILSRGTWGVSAASGDAASRVSTGKIPSTKCGTLEYPTSAEGSRTRVSAPHSQWPSPPKSGRY